MYQLFKTFLIAKAAEFRRMVWKTKGEMAVEDLQNQAWIVADEIGKKRGRQIDFTDPHEQSAVMAALYVKSVKYREKIVQHAVRIDEERSDDDGSATGWADRLPARDTSDPLVFLLEEEIAIATERLAKARLASSFSEAAAYALIFHKFSSRDKVCTFLVISNDVLLHRVRRSIAVLRTQGSLFDRIERISKSFMPLRGIAYMPKNAPSQGGTQLSWTF